MNALDVLYVEDEETDIFIMQHAFKKAGIGDRLHAVKDGKEALDYLAGNAPFNDRSRHPLPGLMLLDLKLPYLSGFEVLAWVRQQQHLKRLPVLICSSSSRPDDIARSYDAGANGYILKPNTLSQFEALTLALRDYWFLHNRPPEIAPAN